MPSSGACRRLGRVGRGPVDAYLAQREQDRVDYYARLEGQVPYRCRRDQLEAFRRGEPVEIDMFKLPVWSAQRYRPPTGMVTVYPDA